ncbi:MAG: hypothetical protein A3H27_02820 [Acidobacteria bacterium RIFCSPLOWO2_02_FULL_59_13]|nr:MAG: hypothetical protein A3H27_02820 [Acidobacteria bacterium RIFCSPLOWO2_02_FULL_59_13]
MGRRSSVVAIVILAFAGLSLTSIAAPTGRGTPSENAPFLLEERYDSEPDPKQRVLIAIKLAEVRLKELQAAYKKGTPAPQKEAAENYLGAVDRLGKAASEAADMGYSKKAEQRLRHQLRELEDLKMAVSYQERPTVVEIAARVAKVQEKILYSIMQPRQESAKR